MASIRVTSERVNFSQIPHWVLEGSSNAVKLYCVLAKYANVETAEAYPSRSTLAEHMGFKRPQSVDPIVAELEAMGAIRVFRSKSGGRNAPNVYHMLWEKPEEPQDVVVRSDALFDVDDDGIVRSGAKNSAVQPQTIVRSTAHEQYPYNYNQEQEDSSARAEADSESKIWTDEDEAKTVAGRVAKATKNGYTFRVSKNIMVWGLGEGYSSSQVENAIAQLWHAGRMLSRTAVAQVLAGVSKDGGSGANGAAIRQQAAKSVVDQLMERERELAQQFREIGS